MPRKLQISVFMAFSFAVIAFGGYHCSLRAQNPQGQGYGPGGENSSGQRGRNYGDDGRDDGRYNDYDDDYGDDYGDGDRRRAGGRDDSLPEEPEEGCNRRQYRNLSGDWGESAYVRFNRSAIRDYRFGRESNFGLKCTRLYLDMEPAARSGKAVYEGSLIISYEDSGTIKRQTFKSGRGAEENKHNYWRGRSWRADRKDNVDQKFYAIFEGRDAAIILKIDEVVEADVRDGDTEFRGYGELWFKMFRNIHCPGGRCERDVCYRDGNYMRFATTGASKPGARCWLLDRGPFSCKPQGVNSRSEIRLDGSLPCYSKLGEFGNLKINKAFNVDRSDDHPE